MYDIEHIRRTLIDHANRHYQDWKEAAEQRLAPVAFEHKAKYDAVAAVAMELFDVSQDELMGQRKSAVEQYAQPKD